MPACVLMPDRGLVIPVHLVVFCTNGLLITDARGGNHVKLLTVLRAQCGLDALCVLPDLTSLSCGSDVSCILYHMPRVMVQVALAPAHCPHGLLWHTMTRSVLSHLGQAQSRQYAPTVSAAVHFAVTLDHWTFDN